MQLPCRLTSDHCKSIRSFLGQDDNLKPCCVLRSPCRALTGIVRCHCDVSTGYRLTIFCLICHCAELNKIVEATMPVNLYDDRKVSLRRPQGNGDLDIVRAMYTCCKANVTEAKDNGEHHNFLTRPQINSLCLGYICHSCCAIYLSTIFSTIFWHRRGFKLRRMCLQCLRSPYYFFL